MLTALVSYYSMLANSRPEEVPLYGWCVARVSYFAHLSMDGELVAMVPIVDRGAMTHIVPAQAKRASGVAANFICDKASYIFGIDDKSNTERLEEQFAAARELHHEVLDSVNSDCARAILRFFDRGRLAANHPVLTTTDEKLLAGGNLILRVENNGVLLDPLKDEAIKDAWIRYYSAKDADQAMRCLVTGELAPIERIHPAIKGVYGAQSSGASVVSFNKRAFESYGHDAEQGRNAPVSKRAAHAYTTALNYLLSHRRHNTRLGDTTVVYWSDCQDEQNCQVFSHLMGLSATDNDGTKEDANRIVDATMKAVARGEYRDLDGVDLDATFYILGLAPSNARLVVKFFLKDSFGRILGNVAKHYRQSGITHGPLEREHLTPYQLLKDVEHPKTQKPVVIPILSGPLLRSILEDAPYPQALYTNALLRVHATQEDTDKQVRKVTRARASIIRAYLIRNCKKRGYDEEGLTMGLNESRNEVAYCLGRAFAILEYIQEEANGKATITNRYFNAASTTPLVVFPSMIRLSDAHLTKMGREKAGLAMHLKRQLHSVLGEERVPVFPKRLSLEEQGDFILGYIHQRNSRYESRGAKSARFMDITSNEEE